MLYSFSQALQLAGGLVGLIIFGRFGISKESNDIFQQGLRLMAMIGFVMIAASGFANVINTTSGVKELVIQSKGVAAFFNVTRWVIDYHGYWFFFSQLYQLLPQFMYHFVSFGFSPLATVLS